MFYHAREIRYVEYGKVEPPPLETFEDYWRARYEWLGRHCGFCPQIWLSRSRSQITGMRRRRPQKSWQRDQVLFGFDFVRGFAVGYDFWEELLVLFGDAESQVEFDSRIEAGLDERLADAERHAFSSFELTWRETRSLEDLLQRHLFVERDQVVVPNLNLKSAKEILCRSERQKKRLLKLGFIEDRIRILNLAREQ